MTIWSRGRDFSVFFVTTPEMSCMSSKPQAVDNVQYNISKEFSRQRSREASWSVMDWPDVTGQAPDSSAWTCARNENHWHMPLEQGFLNLFQTWCRIHPFHRPQDYTRGRLIELPWQSYVLLNCCSCQWGWTVSLNSGHQRAYCSCPIWYIYEYRKPQWNDIDRINRGTRRKTCPVATLSTTNPSWRDLGANPASAVRLVTNRLSRGTARNSTKLGLLVLTSP
jgi:hypothetical protein